VLAVLAGAQLLAIAVFFAGIEAEVGGQDEWVDYPAPVASPSSSSPR